MWLSDVAESILGVPGALENVATLAGEASDDLSVIYTDAWVYSMAASLVELEFAGDELSDLTAPTQRTEDIQSVVDLLALNLWLVAELTAEGFDSLDIDTLEQATVAMEYVATYSAEIASRITTLCE